ncbi:hypothetical protein MRX96_020434 [Rhipicephalus microplus]
MERLANNIFESLAQLVSNQLSEILGKCSSLLFGRPPFKDVVRTLALRYRHIVKKSDLDSAIETTIYLSLLQFQAVIKFVLGGVVSLQLASLRQQRRRRKDAR